MSIDITIEAPASAQLSFDDFARQRIPRIGRALQVATEDAVLAQAALVVGARSVHVAWTNQRSFDEAEQHVFVEAVRHCCELNTATELTDDTVDADHIVTMANALARHVFGWDTNPFEQQASGDPLTAAQAEDLRQRVAEAEPVPIEIAAISADEPRPHRRRLLIGVAAIGALLVLGALAQFVARPDRGEPALERPGATAAPFERPSFPGENMDLDTWVPPERQVRTPLLITSGATGGFVGIEPDESVERGVTFATSQDGMTWTRAGTWNTGSAAVIQRLERVGDTYLVWSSPAAQRQSAAAQLAFSRDLITWQTLDLPAPEPQPFGLIYRSKVADILVRDETVLARVTTEVEIDFAALSLSEGYTCGHSIADDAVSVNMCTSQLDVLTYSGIERLPAPNQLFVSRDGLPFEPTSEPFGRQTQAQLVLTEGVFSIADETGLVFATSGDAQTWQATSAPKPTFPVSMSATSETGQVLGTGTRATGEPMLFFNDGPNTTTISLNQIVAEASNEANVLVASGPTRWAAYVYEPQGPAWIAASDDGLNWNVADAPRPSADSVHLVVSSDRALVDSTSADGTRTLTAVSLP